MAMRNTGMGANGREKPNRIIKRSFIESAMCNHNIVMLLMGMLVFVGILGISASCRKCARDRKSSAR